MQLMIMMKQWILIVRKTEENLAKVAGLKKGDIHNGSVQWFLHFWTCPLAVPNRLRLIWLGLSLFNVTALTVETDPPIIDSAYDGCTISYDSNVNFLRESMTCMGLVVNCSKCYTVFLMKILIIKSLQLFSVYVLHIGDNRIPLFAYTICLSLEMSFNCIYDNILGKVTLRTLMYLHVSWQKHSRCYL